MLRPTGGGEYLYGSGAAGAVSAAAAVHHLPSVSALSSSTGSGMLLPSLPSHGGRNPPWANLTTFNYGAAAVLPSADPSLLRFPANPRQVFSGSAAATATGDYTSSVFSTSAPLLSSSVVAAPVSGVVAFLQHPSPPPLAPLPAPYMIPPAPLVASGFGSSRLSHFGSGTSSAKRATAGDVSHDANSRSKRIRAAAADMMLPDKTSSAIGRLYDPLSVLSDVAGAELDEG